MYTDSAHIMVDSLIRRAPNVYRQCSHHGRPSHKEGS